MEVEGVDGGLAAVMVVGDGVDLFGLFADGFDLGDPRFEFFAAVEIVVAVVATDVFAKPIVVISAMEADVGERGGDAFGGSDRVLEEGLVDVAEGNTTLSEALVDFRQVPGGMAQLEREGVGLEGVDHACEPLSVSGAAFEAPWELNQDGAEPSGLI